MEIRREYLLLVLCNLVGVLGVAGLLGRAWASEQVFVALVERLGRAGPAGLLLVAASLAVAWWELLLLPTLRLRAELATRPSRQEA